MFPRQAFEGSAFATPRVDGTVSGRLGGLDLSAELVTDNRLVRYLQGSAASGYQTADTGQRDTAAAGWGLSTPQRPDRAMPWTPASGQALHVVMPLTLADGRNTLCAAPWLLAQQHQALWAAVHQHATSVRQDRAALHALAQLREQLFTEAGQVGAHRRAGGVMPWSLAARIERAHVGASGASQRRVGLQLQVMPWQGSRWAPMGASGLPVVPVTPGFEVDGRLVFECPPIEGFPLPLVFGFCPCTPSALLQILPARYYMTVHAIIAHRLPDLAEVPLFDATISTDVGSFCWTLSARGPASVFGMLAASGGLPAQLRVTLDGIPWVFAVDGLGRESAFGKTATRVTGRSVTALLAKPYGRSLSRTNGVDRTAQQLAADALDLTGVALDWGLVDWLVPAGVWSHYGTALEAVQAIAQAAGGYVQSHRSAATLLARHPYAQRAGDLPGAPWGWYTGAADVELAADAIITEAADRRDGPDINAVWVSGVHQGVLARVKRGGTAGDKLADMVAEALAVHADAARQRGLAIVGAAGAKEDVRLSLPVLTGGINPGVLDVGQVVQVNDAVPWRGRVRAVSVAAALPRLRQSVTLERHLEVAP